MYAGGDGRGETGSQLYGFQQVDTEARKRIKFEMRKI